MSKQCASRLSQLRNCVPSSLPTPAKSSPPSSEFVSSNTSPSPTRARPRTIGPLFPSSTSTSRSNVLSSSIVPIRPAPASTASTLATNTLARSFSSSASSQHKSHHAPKSKSKSSRGFSVREHIASLPPDNDLETHPKYGFPVNPEYKTTLAYVNRSESGENAPASLGSTSEPETDVNMTDSLPISLQKQVVQLSKDMEKLQRLTSLPIQDIVVKNYEKLKTMALKSSGSNSRPSNNQMKDKPDVHVIENIGGAFHALADSGKRSGSGTGTASLPSTKSVQWSLPEVEGVRPLAQYSSDPTLSSTEIAEAADRHLIAAREKLMLMSAQQALLGDGNTIDGTSRSADTQRLLGGMNGDTSLAKVGDKELRELLIQQESALEALKSNVPLSPAFLPPHTYVNPPLNAMEGDKEMEQDTIATVIVPQNVIKAAAAKMNERNVIIAKKLGLKEKDVPRVRIPHQAEINHAYNKIMKKAELLLKETIKSTGFGHVLQIDEKINVREELSASTRVDDVEVAVLDDGYWVDGISEISKKGDKREKVVLPVVSEDGYSDSHLPVAVRQSLSLMRKSFDQLRIAAEPTPTAYTLMMTTYAELGMPMRAAELFDDMRNNDDTVPDATSFNVMLDILANANKVNTACRLFEEMRETAVRFGHGQSQSPGPQHALARKADRLKNVAIAKARAQGITNLEMDSGLMDMAKELDSGSFVVADKTEELIARPDVVTYTTIIKALGKIGDRAGALQVFNQMRKDKVEANEIAWTAAINVMCRAGDFKAGLRLLHEMRQSGCKPTKATYRAMVASAGREGQVSLSIALMHQMTNDGMTLDPALFGSLIRGLAEAACIQEALRLHQQLSLGRFGPNTTPSRTTYNALLEAIADPHSWARLSLPDIALQTGLAIYQEALLLGIFPHPYSERNENGIVDLRPYTRGAVLFPIHFFLNLTVNHVTIAPDGVGDLVKNLDKIIQQQNQHGTTPSKKYDLRATKSIMGATTASSTGTGTGAEPENALSTTVTSTFSDAVRNGVAMYFPRITVPRKGVMMVASKELRREWSSAAKPLPFNSGSTRLRQRNGEDFDPVVEAEPKLVPMREYVERILLNTRPWIHYSTVKSNPNVVVVGANTLRYWMSEQRKRLRLDQDDTPSVPTNPFASAAQGNRGSHASSSSSSGRHAASSAGAGTGSGNLLLSSSTRGDDVERNSNMNTYAYSKNVTYAMDRTPLSHEQSVPTSEKPKSDVVSDIPMQSSPPHPLSTGSASFGAALLHKMKTKLNPANDITIAPSVPPTPEYIAAITNQNISSKGAPSSSTSSSASTSASASKQGGASDKDMLQRKAMASLKNLASKFRGTTKK